MPRGYRGERSNATIEDARRLRNGGGEIKGRLDEDDGDALESVDLRCRERCYVYASREETDDGRANRSREATHASGAEVTRETTRSAARCSLDNSLGTVA